MNDYSRATGRQRASEPVVDHRNARAPAPLTEAEQARTAAARAFVLEHMPELRPLIADLVKEGLLPGWRGVVNPRLLADDSR